MPRKTSNASQDIYQIKVTLSGTKPPIWRRLLVPADFTLGQLHDVLQLAMGWQDCHLHSFDIADRTFGVPDPGERAMGMPTTLNERTARLSRVLGGAGSKALYTYDFGDTWEHAIEVEKVLVRDPDLPYPICVAGKRQGPPEDCGGVWGFYNLLDAIRDPEHPDHDELREWLGGDFDPEAFSAEEVNERLAPLQKRRSKSAGTMK